MTYTVEKSLTDFSFWSGARSVVARLTDAELKQIEEMLEESNVALSETDINDFFWYDLSTIIDWLGTDEDEDSFFDRPVVRVWLI